MGDGDGGVARQEELGQRLTYNAAASHDHGSLPLDRYAVIVEHGDATGRGSRHECIEAEFEPPDVDRVDAVHVLLRVEHVDYGVEADVGRKGHLHNHAGYLLEDVEAAP